MKRNITVFMAGLLTGAALFGGGVAYAAGVIAEHAPQTAYVDGTPVQLEAYNIDGYNYVKLRDIGQAVGFNVYWDGQFVQMDSDAPYTGIGPTQEAAATALAGGIEVGSFKGSTLKAGERGALIIYPYDPNDTAVSSDPSVLTVEMVLGHWTAIAQNPGTATITIKAEDGRSGSVTITVVPDTENTIDLNANMEIRQEMIRLINEVRRANGVSELSVNAALMDAAQDISTRKYTTHHTQEECETAMAYGYPYGFGNNLTVFSCADPTNIARIAVNNWVNSPGHFQAMIDPSSDCIGVGVTWDGSRTYCHMFAGVPNSYTMYN